MPGVTMPDGMASEWVMETALPSPSTTLRWVVSRGTGAPGFTRSTLKRWPARICAAASRARSLLSSCCSGTSKNLGSPIKRSLSAVAFFMASHTRRMYSGPLCSRAPRSNGSRMFSICSSMAPPPGGWLVATVRPR